MLDCVEATGSVGQIWVTRRRTLLHLHPSVSSRVFGKFALPPAPCALLEVLKLMLGSDVVVLVKGRRFGRCPWSCELETAACKVASVE